MINLTQTCCLIILIYSGNSLASRSPPRITSDKPFVQVKEGISSLSTKLLTLTATELNGGTVDIQLGGNTNEIVKLNNTRTSGSVTTADVFLKIPLDRERQPSYTLRFVAVSSDPNLPSDEVIPPVSLFVQDINDNPPKFSQLAYRIEIPENRNITNDIGVHISATDPDNGPGGTVSYAIQPVGQASGLYGHTFGIDSTNGRIQLLKQLDYEKTTFYKYRVIASGTFLFKVLAVDGDLSIQNNITYSVDAGVCASSLTINRTSGFVYTTAILDRDNAEMKKQNGVCNLIIKASEVTPNPSSLTESTASTALVITDLNDNPPTFSRASVEGYVQEGETDTLISITGGLQVEDRDQGENSIIDMSVTQGDGRAEISGIDVFPAVVAQSGHVFLKLVNGFKFDNSVRPIANISLVLKAEDRGIPRQTSYCHLTVHINKTNKSYPIFSFHSYNFSVQESTVCNTLVGEVQAFDSDAGLFGVINYALKGPGIDEFNIDSNNGRIYISCRNGLLDRERQPVYHFTVEARDGGGKMSSAFVTIVILDLNDNYPYFIQQKYEFGITENSTLMSGMKNISVHAVDFDEPMTLNSLLTYAIMPRPDALDKHFAINNVSGTIRMVRTFQTDQLSSALGGKFDLQVIAHDHGSPSLTSTATITAFFQQTQTRPSTSTSCNCTNMTTSHQTQTDANTGDFTGQSFVLCQGQEGYIQCASGKAIRVLSAVYGRLADDICPSHHVGSLTCHAPSATDHVRWSCNGYRRCSLFADSSVFGEPCPGVNKYLEVSFHCVDHSSTDPIFG